MRTKPLDASRWQKELLTKRFTPSRAGEANPSHEDSYRNLLARECFYRRPFHLPTSIGRTFFPNLPAMPRVPGLEAVCTQATVRNGLFNYSPRAFHHLIAANSASRGGHSSKTLRPFQRNVPAIPAKRSCLFCATTRPFHQKETPDGAGFLPVPRPVPGCPDYSPVFTSC